jgi:hypothetical protein
MEENMNKMNGFPASIEGYREYFEAFVEGMLKKLDKNSYKNTPTVNTIHTIIDLMEEEIAEFELQFSEDKYDENTLIELMDVANFAFLAYIALRMQGVGNGE